MNDLEQQDRSNMQADVLQNFNLRNQQLAARRKLAESLIAQGMQGQGGQGYHGGRVYMVGNALGPLAKSLGGAYLNSRADAEAAKNELAQRAAMNDFTANWQNASPEQREQLLQNARNVGLDTSLERDLLKSQQAQLSRREDKAIEQSARAEIEREKAEARAQEKADQRQWQEGQNALYRRLASSIGSGGNAKAPVGYRWNADGTELEAIPGGPKDPNAKPEKPVNLTAAQQKAYDDSNALLGHVDNAMELLKNNPTALGYKTVLPDMALSKIDPEGVATRAAVGGLSAERVHRLSGAAVTPAEFARLRPYLPASGDTSDAVAKKLTNLRAEVERIKAAHAAGPTRAQPKAPAVGTVKGGYRFKGGNPADPSSWEAVK